MKAIFYDTFKSVSAWIIYPAKGSPQFSVFNKLLKGLPIHNREISCHIIHARDDTRTNIIPEDLITCSAIIKDTIARRQT